MARKKKLPEGMRYGQDGKRIQYRFRINGQRFSVYGFDIKECYQKAEEKEKQEQDKNYKSNKDLTLNEYFERWIEAKAGTVKETTIRTNKILYAICGQQAIDQAGHTLGELKVREIEAQNIRDIQTQIVESGRSTRTANDSISLLKSILQTAIDTDRIITWNPAAGIKRLRRTEEPARNTYHRALTEAETKAFFAKASERQSWYYNLYCFLIDTGCRCGEAGALMNSDISDSVIHINKTITRTEAGTYKIGTEAKTAAGTRNIPIRSGARRAIEKQKAINNLLNNGVIRINDTVFKSPRGELLNDTAVNQDIERICKAAGIERFTAHAFRDTFATRCVESGMQTKTLQEILGHTDISMTMNLYAHVMDETKAEQMQSVVINY